MKTKQQIILEVMKKHDKELDQFEDGQLSQQEYDKILSHSLEEVYDKGYFLGMDIAVERINSANKSTTRGEIFDKVLADIRTDTIKEIIEIEENKRKWHYHPMWNKAKTNTVQELKAMSKLMEDKLK